MGKILRAFPDPQGIIRSVKVEEGGRVSLHPVSYLVPLEPDCHDNERDNTEAEMVSNSQEASFNEADEPPTNEFESTIRGSDVTIHLGIGSSALGPSKSPPAQSAVMQLSGLAEAHSQGWLQGYVIGGGGVKENLTNSRRSMLRFDRLESVNVEV